MLPSWCKIPPVQGIGQFFVSPVESRYFVLNCPSLNKIGEPQGDGFLHRGTMKKRTLRSNWFHQDYQAEGITYEDWEKLRKDVFIHDKYTCQRCFRRFRKGGISCHHIIPRNKGGGSYPQNLITLCHHCHDYVEINELTSRAAIQGSYVPQLAHVKTISFERVKTAQEKGIEPFERPDWHAWVYGGEKHREITKTEDELDVQ